MPSSPTRIISRSTVKPLSLPQEEPYYLTPWDLECLGYFVQFGLLYHQPDRHDPNHPIIHIDRLKHCLALTLAHFVPLSGRIAVQTTHDPPSYCVYSDCKDPKGAEFVHAVAPGVAVADILNPTDVPRETVVSLFALPPGVHRDHTVPLLLVQVTQLADGIFIAFSVNHGLADGASFWHFINSYAEICRSTKQQFLQNDCVISRPPVTKRWFLNDQRVNIPGSYSYPTDDDQGVVVDATTPPPQGLYRERIFHFTSKVLAHMKARANRERGTREISSYEALAALIWRSVTRARGLKGDQTATCAFSVNCRSRLEPPLSDAYFGNCLMTEFVSTPVDELLSNNLGWAAWRLHDSIAKCDNNKVRAYVEQFSAENCDMDVNDPGILILGNLRWFDMYGNDFGWGKPIAVRASDALVDGYVQIMPGAEQGSIDLVTCFFSKTMDELELDEEFMGALSFARHPLSKI